MKYFQSLRSKVNIAIVITFLIVTLIFSVIVTIFEIQRRITVVEQIKLSLTDLAINKRKEIGDKIFAGHIRAIKSTLSSILKRDEIIAASAYDLKGDLLVSIENEPLPSDLKLPEPKSLFNSPYFSKQILNEKSVLTFTSVIRVFGEKVGYWKIYYSLNKVEQETYLIVGIFSALLLTTLIMMGMLLNILLYKIVLKPIIVLKDAMQQVNKGNVGTRVNLQQWGIQTFEIREMVQTFNKMSTDLVDFYKTKIARKVAEASVRAKSEFLNNSGQGFLSFGQDLLVDEEYSLECENIFGRVVSGKSIATFLYPTDATNRMNIEKKFIEILSEGDEYVQELYISLLEEEYLIGNKFVKAQYKIIAQNKMMLILTDMTTHKKLETEIYNEHKKLKFVVAATREPNYFFGILDDFEQFCGGRFQELISPEMTEEEILSEFYRHVHTFKSLFAQQYFLYLPDALHKMEDGLSKIRKNKAWNIDDLEGLMEKYECQKTLDKDIAIIGTLLGKKFLKQKERRRGIIIPRDHIDMIKDMVNGLLKLDFNFIGQKNHNLLLETKKILQINLKKMIFYHLNDAIKLSERLGKNIEHFAIEGDDIFVDASIYAPFTRTLVHVFRNAVDHGIETPDERKCVGKKQDAELICFIEKKIIKKRTTKKTDNQIIILVSDNGKGLDTSKIRMKAVEYGIFTKEEVIQISDNEIHQLIFNEHFSTSDTVTELSGRGIGLDSVRVELSKLGGDIEIETEEGSGTTFKFIIPIISDEKDSEKVI